MRRYVTILGVLGVVVLTTTLLDGAPPKDQETECCYTNSQGYQGVCVVTPGEGETCESILAYLNNPQSAGKNYCGNTKVRGGWTRISCEEERHPSGCPSSTLSRSHPGVTFHLTNN